MKFPGYTTRKMVSGRDMYEAHDNAMSFLRRQHQMGKKFKFKIEPTDIEPMDDIEMQRMKDLAFKGKRR